MGVRVPGFLAYSVPSRPRPLGILDLNAKWARVGTVGQVLVDGLVAGHAGGIDVLQLEDDALGLRLRQLLVQPQQCLAQPPLQQHLPLVAALGRQRCARHIRPPQPLQQLARRRFGTIELGALGGGRGHGLAGAFSSGK